MLMITLRPTTNHKNQDINFPDHVKNVHENVSEQNDDIKQRTANGHDAEAVLFSSAKTISFDVTDPDLVAGTRSWILGFQELTNSLGSSGCKNGSHFQKCFLCFP